MVDIFQYLVMYLIPYLRGLLDDAVPHLIGQQHVFFYQVLLYSLICLGPDHITYSLVERVHLNTTKETDLKKSSDNTVTVMSLKESM